jgi:hypothetical protein
MNNRLIGGCSSETLPHVINMNNNITMPLYGYAMAEMVSCWAVTGSVHVRFVVDKVAL